MKIVIDTNIVFSAILNTNSKIGDLLLNSDQSFEFYSTNYLKLEIEKHKPKLQEISKMDASQIEQAKILLYSKITFISEEIIPFEIWKASAQVVKDVDMDDIAFVALSKFMGNVKLLTGDKKLYNGIRAKGFSQIINLQEIEILRTELETK